MREIQVKAPAGGGQAALAVARQHGGVNTIALPGSDGPQEYDLVIAYVPNRAVAPLLAALSDLDRVEITLSPHDVFPMDPGEPDRLSELSSVQPRSPVEVWLNGIQSIGSWEGLVAYAVAAGLIVWVGMYTNTIYLLVAAMLIAPYVGPAMDTALASATGDGGLLLRSVGRYFVALLLTIGVTWLMSLALDLQIATATMVQVAEVSAYAVILPAVAGAAGAYNLVQARNSHLVTGTAVGLLVAAALAPPAALLGMAAALGEWTMARSATFLLLLQLVGINLTGSVVFRLKGLGPEGPVFDRGRGAVFYASVALSTLVLAALLYWQFADTPSLQRTSIARNAEATIEGVVEDDPDVIFVETRAHFTAAGTSQEAPLLAVVYVQTRPGRQVDPDEVSRALTERLQTVLADRYDLTPLVEVTVLSGP